MATSSPDVLIIGAGIIGGSIGWRLAQAGARVTLLEAGKLGGEASWAGAGMLAPGGEFVTRSRWASFAMESLALYPAFVAELEEESGVKIDYRRCGAIEFAGNDAEREELMSRRSAQAELDIRSEFTAEGLVYPDDALVDPRDVTRALRCAVEKRGGRIVEQTRATAVRVAEGRVEVEAGGGRWQGGMAVLAAGAWSGAMPVSGAGGRMEIPATFPVRGHLLGYALEPGSLGPILRRGHTYVMQRSNGFTIAGTSSEQVGFDRNLNPQIVAEIRERAGELMPGLRDAGEPVAWLGFRPATQNFEPVIGRVEGTGLWLAYGHYRNGILLAPATAARVAGEMMARREPAA